MALLVEGRLGVYLRRPLAFCILVLFLALKKTYRKHIRNLAVLNDMSLSYLQDFIRCNRKVKEAFVDVGDPNSSSEDIVVFLSIDICEVSQDIRNTLLRPITKAAKSNI